MFRPLIIIKRIPSIDFMELHKLGFALSGVLTSARSCCSSCRA